MNKGLKALAAQAVKFGQNLGARLYSKEKHSSDYIVPYKGADAYYSYTPKEEINVTDTHDVDDFTQPPAEINVTMNREAPEQPEKQPEYDEEAVARALGEDTSAFSVKEFLNALLNKLSPKEIKDSAKENPKLISSLLKTLPFQNEEDVPEDEIVFDEEQLEKDEEHAQKAFAYYQGISEKLEGLRQVFSEKTEHLSEKLKTRDADEKIMTLVTELSSQLKELKEEQLPEIEQQLTKASAENRAQTEAVRTLLEETVTDLKNAVDQMQTSVNAFDTCASSKMDALSDSMANFYDLLRSADNACGETRDISKIMADQMSDMHANITGISKLHDSVFELKTATNNMKTSLAELTAAQQSLGRKCLVGFILLGVAGLACIGLEIAQFFF